MNYYEHQMLKDRESRGIWGGVAFVLLSPLGGIIGAYIGEAAGDPTLGFYLGTAIVAAIGIGVIVGAVKEKRKRLHDQYA